MTLLAMPSTLPAPMLGGHQFAPADQAQRNAIGPAVSRRRTAGQRGEVTATWRLSDAAFAVFDAFWFGVLFQGAAWFTATMGTDAGFTTATVRFQGGYTAKLIGGGWWEVSARLDVDGPL